MKKPLTPEEKQRKILVDAQRYQHNVILSKFSFKQVKSWLDVYSLLGYKEEEAKIHAAKHVNELKYPELKELLKKREYELEQTFKPTPKVEEQTVPTVTPTTRTEPVKSSEQLQQTQKPIVQSTPNTDGSSKELPKPEPTEKVEVVTKVELLNEDNNWGLTPSPNENTQFWWHQKKAITELLDKIIIQDKNGILVVAATGTGKTWIMLGAMRRALDQNLHEGHTYSHIPYLVLSKSTIVTQTERVAKRFFNITAADCEITNIETMRSSAGEYWIKQTLDIVNGQEVETFKWKPRINPYWMLVDESQGVRRKGAKQTKAIAAFTKLPDKDAKVIYFSASPFTRVSEARTWAISTKRPLDHLKIFPPGTILDEKTWPVYAQIIASPAKPEDYDKAAVDRLMDDLDDWVVRVKNVRPQFSADNKVHNTNFRSESEFKFYHSAWERFLEEKAKIDAAKEAGDATGTCYLVVLLKFAMAAEFCHAPHFAEDMYNDVYKHGKAAVAAVKFKQTAIEIFKQLMAKGVTRDQISFIWGGGQTKLTKKQEAKNKVKALEEQLKKLGISVDEMLQDTGLEEVEDRTIEQFPPEWRLGPQSPEERQAEIDRFQSGKTLFCIYTLKAGGVGLSLHHTDELTTKWDESKPGFAEWKKKIDEWNKNKPANQQCKPGKVRRKKNGYAYEEDIPFIPVRPRKTYVTVTYNAIELVQGIGRVPRLTSLSPTEQWICCFNGTIEIQMGRIYSKKLRCLSAVVRQKEDWQQAIFQSATDRENYIKQITSQNEPEDESTLIDEGDADEESDELERTK